MRLYPVWPVADVAQLFKRHRPLVPVVEDQHAVVGGDFEDGVVFAGLDVAAANTHVVDRPAALE
mgnify:CR=1 FL=1